MYRYRKLTPQQKALLVQQRLENGYPPHSPPHTVENQAFYLITAACYEHKNRLNTSIRRQQILDLLFEYLINESIGIVAWVILPNHYHLLTTTVDFKVLSKILRLIHGKLAYQWNQEDKRLGKVWCSYSDRAIRSERHYYATLNYIHYNPVKHGWVNYPDDWAESSLDWYLHNKGEDWLNNCWIEYPIKDYGKDWDN